MSSEGNKVKLPGNKCLIVCDVQLDALKSIESVNERNSFLDAVKMAIHVARKAGWKIIWTGLSFQSGYQGLEGTHKLFGALRRLNEKLGDKNSHWFMDGYDGTNFDPFLIQQNADEDNDPIFWRQSHLPSSQMLEYLKTHRVTEASVVGMKLGFAVQSIVQAVCDLGTIDVYVVKEAVIDDTKRREEVLLKHFIPLYGTVVTLPQWIDATLPGGLAAFSSPLVPDAGDSDVSSNDPKYFADCGRAGHIGLYSAHLVQRNHWRQYPTQPWYTDQFSGKSYLCPLGKQKVTFCDEPKFSSKVSMYIKGREWLDEKEKVVQLEAAKGHMPETYHIDNGRWVGLKPNDHDPHGSSIPLWFVKECDKNGGKAITICRTVAECEQAATASSFVVQPHLADPLLTTDGRKCHLKIYFLLRSSEDGTWSLSSWNEPFLCVASGPWSRKDLSSDTQITVLRTHRLKTDAPCDLWTGWPHCYEAGRRIAATVIDDAIGSGKVQTRPDQAQFEIISADFMMTTTAENPVLIEFNFGCVMFDPTIGQELTTKGLKEYQRQYDSDCLDAPVNDHDMIAGALDEVFGGNHKSSKNSQWEAMPLQNYL